MLSSAAQRRMQQVAAALQPQPLDGRCLGINPAVAATPNPKLSENTVGVVKLDEGTMSMSTATT
eukprot:SAG31_NODE_2333_length_5929_cov_3.477702_2_plen_64_part_00